jgi:hypothetical protein
MKHGDVETFLQSDALPAVIVVDQGSVSPDIRQRSYEIALWTLLGC